MELINDISHLTHHRSKKRIRDFGEVFTPEKYVQQMLDMLDRTVWADTSTVFFEPTCGHGNFVSAIVERRLKALWKKAKRKKIKNPHFYAVANTLNNLWAIDIDPENIELCRSRVFDIVFNFLCQQEQNLFFIFKEQGHSIFPEKRQAGQSNLKPSVFKQYQHKKMKELLAHVLCCLEWQIQENEALSCLEADPVKAKRSADKTTVSRNWFKKNGHRPIDFKNTWCQYLQTYKESNIIPVKYIRTLKILDSLLGDKMTFKEKPDNISSILLREFYRKHNKIGKGLSYALKSKKRAGHNIPCSTKKYNENFSSLSFDSDMQEVA